MKASLVLIGAGAVLLVPAASKADGLWARAKKKIVKTVKEADRARARANLASLARRSGRPGAHLKKAHDDLMARGSSAEELGHRPRLLGIETHRPPLIRAERKEEMRKARRRREALSKRKKTAQAQYRSWKMKKNRLHRIEKAMKRRKGKRSRNRSRRQGR